MTDRPQVVLHIGTHKTGTTAFRRYALANRGWLAANGVDFYVHESGAPHTHELPMITLRSELSIPLRVRNLHWTLEEAKKVMASSIRSTIATAGGALQLFSHEALSFVRQPEEIERLQHLFAGADMSVVLVRREPESFLSSCASSLSGWGSTRTARIAAASLYPARPLVGGCRLARDDIPVGIRAGCGDRLRADHGS